MPCHCKVMHILKVLKNLEAANDIQTTQKVYFYLEGK